MYVSAPLEGRTAREIQLQSNYVINSVWSDDFGSTKSGAQVCGLFNKESPPPVSPCHLSKPQPQPQLET